MFSLAGPQHGSGRPIHDVYCGMRGFTKRALRPARPALHGDGIRHRDDHQVAACIRRDIAEVPITLHPDGRKAHAPHLKTFRDGWRTLRFFLMYSPRWLFLVPGLAADAARAPRLRGRPAGRSRLRRVTFDAHTLLFASLAILCGYQSILFAVFTKIFAVSEGLMPADPRLKRFFDSIGDAGDAA